MGKARAPSEKQQMLQMCSRQKSHPRLSNPPPAEASQSNLASDGATRLGGGAALRSTAGFYARPSLRYKDILPHVACSVSSPCRARQLSWLLDTALKNRARHRPPLFLAAPARPRLFLSNLARCSRATTKQQKTATLQSYTGKASSATQSVRIVALKRNLPCHGSRWFSFLHPPMFCTSCRRAMTHSPCAK